MVIWKWKLQVEDSQVVMMPGGAQILDVQMQAGQCCIWALCNPDAEETKRWIAMYAMGHQVPDNSGEYISTFQMSDGQLVFHAFEIQDK